MPKYKPLYSLYKGLKESKYDVPDSYASFQKTLTQAGDAGAKSRRGLYKSLKESNYDIPDTYEDFYKNLFVPVNSTTSRALKIGENPNTPAVNRYHQKLFDSVDPNKNGLNALSHRAVSQAKRAMNNVRKPVTAKYVNREGKPIGEEFAITPAKTVEDLDREYAQETTKNWENELHDQMADADKDAAKISDMFKSFIGSTDEVGSVWGNMTRGGGIAGTPHSVTTNNGILENTEARQLLAAGDYNRKRKELLQLEQDSRNGATFDNHSFFRGMYDAAKDTGILTGGASDLINAGSLLATKQDLDNGVHTKAGDMLMQQAVKNSNAQSQYGDNQGWMYTGGVITTNMAPFMVQIGSAGFSKGISNAIGKVVQGAASKVALGTMEKATGMAGAHIANYIGKVTGLTTKAFGKAIQYGIVGAAQANTVGLGNVANDVINRYTGQVYQDEQGNYKFGTFDSDGNLVHEGGEDFLTAFVKGDAAQTIEFATELAGGGIDAAGTALKNFVTNGGKKIINKYNMENVSKVIDFLLNNKVAKNARYLKAGADRTLGKVEVNSIVGESLEEELGIIANMVFTGDNKISDLWDEKQQSQIWGGMLLSIGLMKGVVAPFHAYNAKQYYSYKHKLNKADVNLSQLLGKEKWEELRNQIDATTNENMPEMVNKINRDVALGKNRQPVREYIQNLLIMRGYDIGNMLAAKKAVEDKGEGVSVKNMEKNQAYQQGRDAYGYDTHEIQLDQEDKQKSLAQLLGISEQQLASMSDEELESFSGRDDNIDRAIYDYQLSSARYEGVVDNARDQIDLEVQRAAQAVDMYTDKSRNTIRNATIKASGGLEDYGVYIISGNIATHDDGSIDVSNSDDMILYYDPTTNTVEHADAMMFAELGSEENADEVRSQAMADAKEKAIKETTGIIDGVVEVGTQFKTVDADGTEHTYEVLADNGDGTAMITIDGNVPTEIVKGENVQVPVSFEELQKMKDESDQQRLQAAKAQREQVEKERAAQQTQETEQTQPSFDFNQILNDDGNVVLADVLGKDGNTKYPNSQLFLIRDSGAKAKVVELTSDGSLIPHAVNKKDVRTATTMTLDEYKQAFAASSMIEDNSGENRGEIEVESPAIEDETTPEVAENTETTAPSDETTETPATEQTPAAPAITLEDGTIVPMLEDGNPDFSKLTAAQTAELYDNQFGEDADSIVSGYVSDAKKALDKANNMTVKGKTFVEQKASKDAKEKAIADAQAAYDSAIAIRDAYNERQLAKVEDTAEGRKELIEKARRKFARLKSAVKDDAEAVAQLYKETVGSLLHRLYDGTGIDVTDTNPLTAEEYVASNLGAHSLNYEGTETSKGVKQETGLSREDFAKTQLLAADGKGTTIDALVHSLWENRPSNLDSLGTQDIRNALIGVLTSGFKASEARSYVENIRIAQAEKLIEEERTAAENAAYYEQQKAKEEEEKKKAELENKAEEEKKKAEENIDLPAIDKQGEPINNNIIELAKWAKKQGLEIDPTSKLNSYADLFLMCKDGFGVSTLVPDEGKNINQVIYFPDNAEVVEQLGKLQEEFNAGRDLNHSSNIDSEITEGATFYNAATAKEFRDFVNEQTKFPDKLKEGSNAIEVPEDATDENPLGLQLSEDKVPFEIEGGKSGETYNINDDEDRQRLINDNKVDDKDILDIDMPKHVHKAIKELCKKMGLKVQFLYMGARSNGWIENGTMYLALDTEKATQFVFGHEMTHAIKQKNPEAYKELVKVAMAVTTRKKFEEDLAKVYQNYHGISGYNNVDDYVEEVVADNLGKFINDFDLAQKFSLRLNHPVLATILHAIQKIKSLLYGDFYKSVDALERIVEKAYVDTAKGEVTNSETGEDVSFSLRQKPEPKKKGVGYKVFVLKNGKLYPPMVANPNGAATPVGVWLDADAAPIAGESKTGRPQVKQGGKGTQGGSGKLAYRPGWHLGVVPYAIQFNRKDADGNKTLFPKNFVFAEVEYAADVDYQEEARQEGINPSGKYQHSLAGLKHLPTDGYYMYRTNPNPETDPWVITGAMKVNRILTRAEQAELVKSAGREPQQIQEGDIVTDDVVNSINQEIADAPKFSLKVYHGSGADFTEFDFDHMGEGAGSQVFGWGGYVTSSKKIGKSYATLMDNDPSKAYYRIQRSNGTRFAKKYPTLESFLHGDKQIAMNDKFTEQEKIDFYNEMKKLAEPYHNLYEVDIPDDNDSNYLDWDKPLSKKQQDAIREGLEHLGVDIKTLESKGQSLERTGENVYNSTLYIGLTGTEYDLPERTKGISKFLSSVGFTGIKYKAGRNFGGAKKGDTNYVIFKPEDMKITEHTKFSIKTYHGSQASFDHFDHSFMGSGEGAQAYGWGTYVSEVEGIAKAYAKQNAAKHGMPREYKIAQTRLNHAKFEYDKVQRRYDNSKAYIDSLKEDLQNYRESMARRKEKVAYFAQNNMPETVDKLLKQIKRAEDTIKVTENDINMRTNDLEGWKPKLEEVKKKYEEEQKKFDAIPKPQIERNLYSVDIPDDTGENYLGWDEKMTHRMRDIRKEILEDNGYKLVDSDDMRDYFEDRDGKEYELFKEQYKTGGTFYEELAQLLHSQKLASLALKEYGFDGVKVIADRTTGGNKEGKMNYVIFDENNAQITNHTKFSLRLKSAIEETETNPSDAQKESGNYKKGHIKFGGYDYTIENPKGSTRSGKDANGKEWKVTMHDTYGYIRGKFGKDGDHLDMFINDKADLDNWNGDVFVVDQVNPDGSFDEHKVMYGYDSMNDAEKAYLANYSKGWQGLGNITGASKAEFDKWLDTSNRKLKPFADYAKVKFSQAQSVSEPRYSLKDIKPVGVGAFGNIYNQFRGKAKAAIEFLKKLGSGEATAALHHHTIGDISLVWGDKKTGLDKILRKHPEVVDNLQSIIDSMEVVQESDNRIKLESPTHFAVVSKEYKGEPREQWLLTAYEKRESLENDKSMDTATSSLGGDTALSQSKGSAAKIDNSSETSKENGEKFSLKDEKTMFGMHNISLDKLRKAIKQGGFAAPSMGVIDSKNGIYSGYGEITLIPKAEKIAKRTGKNIGTYAADAWTPIYPPVEKKFGGNGGDVAYDDIESVPKEMQRLTRNAINSFMDGREANGLAYLYLQEKGKAPVLVHVEGKYPKELHDEVKGILGKLNGIYNTTDEQKEKLLDLFIREVYDGNKEEFDNDIKKFIKKDEELIKKRPNSNIAKNKQLDVDWMKEHGYDYGALSRFVDGILRDAETSGKVDENATMKAAQQYIQDKGMKEDFDSWKEKLNDRYNVEEVIFAGYKPDGNRKYLPNTVENAVKVMKQDGKNASVGSASFSHFVASILKPMGTLDQIRKKKGNLTGNYEDVEKFQEKWQPVYDELADKMQPDAEPFESYGMDRLEEVATQKNPKKYAKEEYGVDLTDEDINKLNELIEAVKNDKPSIYFETKFMRPYGLDEFEKAIVPNDTPSDVVDALKMAGIDVSSYERGNAEDRQKVTMDAINSSDNIRFSLKSMMAKPEGWKQANKKAIHIAEAIERDPKFSLKNLDGTLIKAGTYFSGGGLVEEGLKGIIDPVVAVEYDEKISGVYRNNFGQHIVTADVRDVDPKELVKHIDGEVEYFHASPVCKNYSQAKSNHAEVELDKETAASTAEFINAIKPKVVTIENVKGYKDSEAMKTITDALDANGYTWDADVYNAADYGGYTNRERLIVRAVRDGKLPEKPKKMARKSGWYEAVADIIPTLTEKKNGVAPWMDIRLKADGIDWRNIDKPLYVMGSAYADGKVPHAFADELLPTLRTKSGDVIVMPDGKVYRAMGRVLARVSGVSDDYKMPFSENLSHTIIGNGIPTQLTEHVIAPLLTGSDPKFSIRTYHGTGAKFDKFDLSHSFEGEGSETFGHGVYVTNSKEIGSNYAQRAKDRKGKFGIDYKIDMSADAGQMLSHYINKYQNVDNGLENARQDLKSALEMFPDDETLKELSAILQKRNDEIAEVSNEAYRYDVDIPDDNGENYLGWNESQNFPLEKWYRLWEITHHGFNENEYFKDGGANYDKDRIERIIQMKLDSPENGMQKLPTLKGEELYHALEDFFDRERPLRGAKLASRALSEIGFVGIKYPAGMIHGGAEEGDYNYVIFDEDNANIVGNTRFSLRYDQFEHDLNQWKKDNNLPKDAQRPSIPQRNAGESAVDFLRRVDEYRKQMALWKTAPTYEQHLLSDDTALGEFNRELQKGSVLKRIAFQDSMLAIRKAQEAIMKEVGVDRLNMAEDAYTAENRSHGKGKNEFEEYNNEFLQPLRKAYHQMKKVLGDSYDNVRIYMMAKHGLERDAQMAFKKSLEADYEDVAQRSAAYKAYKGDMNRMGNDSGFELGYIDFTTWRQRDNALRVKYSPSYMNYRYDKMGIAYDYSGLSALFGGSDFEEAASKLVRDIESSHVVEVQDLWNATNAATKKILRDGYKAGMMSKDTYQYVRDMYSHYIPLRGWDGTTADQVWDYIGGGKGAFNQTLKKAHGRTSIADDPIAYIENMAESGILLNNKNWVKQHLMLLAQNHPTSLLTLSKAWYVKSTDANGNEEWIPATPQITSQMNSNQVKAAIDAFEQKMEQMAQTGDATQKRDGLNIAYPQTHSEEREHEVRVMKDGEEYVIYVNGDPQLAQAMNNTRAHRVSEGIKNSISKRVIAVVGRKMAAAYTSLSPLFIPSNYFRDLTMTLASTAIREDAKYNYLLRKNLATSWNLGFMLRDYQNGKLKEKVSNGNATPKEQMFYDFMMNGGETGFVSSLDVEDLKKKFKNDLKDLDRWKANPVKVGHTIMDSIEFLNRAIEDSNRFAVYMTSIQYGRSIDEAVNDAKDVTLNFNRKGTGEHSWQTIRNLYLFINPAVQSLQTLGALAKHHPFKFTAVTASWLASGVLVPIVNVALMQLGAAFCGGDGDDKDWYKDISKKYWQFTKWDRRNNLIMWVPTTHEFVKIPLAQEFRAFYGLGDMIASKMMGGELAEESWEDYGWDLVGQVVDMLPLDPTGYDGNILVSLMPNPVRPIFELAFNVDFTGKPLFKETEYNKYDPNFTKAYVGTPDWLVRASKMVNSIGNDYPDVQQNSIDAFGDPRYNLNNPGVVDHVLSSYLGGAYTMGSQVLGLLTKSLNDPKEIKVADIPLLSKFISNPDDRPVTKKQGDEFWNMKENHDRAANTLSKLKKQAKVDGDYSMLERFYGSEEYKQYKKDDVKVKKYEEDKKKERAEESGEEYRPHKLNADDIYKAHATPKDDFEDLKLKQLYTKLNGFKSAYDLLVDTAPNQSEGYYNTNKAAIDAIDEISLDKQEISELKKGFLDDGKDAYNAEDMKQIRELRKKILAVLEKANKVVVANQKANAKKK